jgi:hypothetical protein
MVCDSIFFMSGKFLKQKKQMPKRVSTRKSNRRHRRRSASVKLRPVRRRTTKSTKMKMMSRFGMKPWDVAKAAAVVLATASVASAGAESLVAFQAPRLQDLSPASVEDAVKLVTTAHNEALSVAHRSTDALTARSAGGGGGVVGSVGGVGGGRTVFEVEAARHARSTESVLTNHIKRNKDGYVHMGATFAEASVSAMSGDVVTTLAKTMEGTIQSFVLLTDAHVSFAAYENEKLLTLLTEGFATRLDETRHRAALEASQSVNNIVYAVLDDADRAFDFVLTGRNIPRPMESLRVNHRADEIAAKAATIIPRILEATASVFSPSAGDVVDFKLTHDKFMRIMEFYNAIGILRGVLASNDLRQELYERTMSTTDEDGVLVQESFLTHIKKMAAALKDEHLPEAMRDVTYAPEMAKRKATKLGREVGDNFLDTYTARQDTIDACQKVYGQQTLVHTGGDIVGGVGVAALQVGMAARAVAFGGAFKAISSLLDSVGFQSTTVSELADDFEEMPLSHAKKAAESTANAVSTAWMTANVAYNRQSCVAGAYLYNQWINYAATELERGTVASFKPMTNYIEDVSYQVSAAANMASGVGTPLNQAYEVVDYTVVQPTKSAAVSAATGVVDVGYYIFQAGERAYDAGSDFLSRTGERAYQAGSSLLSRTGERAYQAGSSLLSKITGRFGNKRPIGITPDDMLQIMFRDNTGVTRFGRKKKPSSSHRRRKSSKKTLSRRRRSSTSTSTKKAGSTGRSRR